MFLRLQAIYNRKKHLSRGGSKILREIFLKYEFIHLQSLIFYYFRSSFSQKHADYGKKNTSK